jgi:hypothetical protein
MINPGRNIELPIVIDKKEILKEISNSNVLSVTDIQSLAENVSIGKTIKTVTAKDFHHTSQFSKAPLLFGPLMNLSHLP